MRIKLEPYTVIRNLSKYLVFTSVNNKLFEIDEELAKILINCTECYEVEIDDRSKYLLDIKDNLAEDRTIRHQDTDSFECLVLIVIQGCNLACKYCYGSSGIYDGEGKMSFDVAKQSIDYVVKRHVTDKAIHIAFFGGEPLLNIALVKEAVAYMDDITRRTGIRFTKSITTNATLLTDEIQDYLLRNHVSIKVSIDGPREVHDAMRCFYSGEGTHEIVLKNTETIRRNKLGDARATITPGNLNFNEIEKYLYDIGFSNVGSAFAEELFDDEDYSAICKIGLEHYADLEMLINKKQFDLIKKAYSKELIALSCIHKSAVGNYPCGAGRTFYAVDKDGNFYPCQRFVGKQEFRIGNVCDDVDLHEEFMKQNSIESHKKCGECWCKNLCLGKCAYDNYIKTSRINEPYEKACEMTKILYREAIRLYSLLSDEDKTELF